MKKYLKIALATLFSLLLFFRCDRVEKDNTAYAENVSKIDVYPLEWKHIESFKKHQDSIRSLLLASINNNDTLATVVYLNMVDELNAAFFCVLYKDIYRAYYNDSLYNAAHSFVATNEYWDSICFLNYVDVRQAQLKMIADLIIPE